MRQSEARDLRSFLAEPVEEIVVEEEAKEAKAQLHEGGVRFITPLEGTEMQLQGGAGVRFATPWEGTGGQLHEVGARFTEPLTSGDGREERFTVLWETPPWVTAPTTQARMDDLTLQQTMPIPRIPDLSGAQSGLSQLRPYRLQRYQSRGVPVALSHSASGMPGLRPASNPAGSPAGNKERRTTADLMPAPLKIVPGESSPALQSWERRRHTIYTWLVLLTLFLLVVLGGIGLDSLIANYR